jgi:type IV secretory pathway TraG/TraD family ATPase VirD4
VDFTRQQSGDPPLLVVLDEAANVASLAELDVLASTAAGHGVQLVTVWQDLAQLNPRYGPKGPSVVNNHRAKVFLSGIADPGTLEHASQLAGEEDRRVRSMTVDHYGSASTTDAQSPRRLVPPDALRRLELGTALLLYAHLPPVRVTLRNCRKTRR